MAWDDQQPPWGRKKGPQTPEEFIAALINKAKAFFEGKGQGESAGSPAGQTGGDSAKPGRIASVVGLVALALLVFSAFYTIRPGESGVVLRLGKYAKTTSPGLNMKIPLLDVVHKVDVETVRKEEFGFRTKAPGDRTQYQKQGYTAESLMLTSDRNVMDVEWIVQYKVEDPADFLFRVRDVAQSVRDVSEVTIRRLVGNMDFDTVLDSRALLADAMARELQETLSRYRSGVRIITVQLQDVNPPEPVKPAFNEVNEADQDMKRLVNEAEEAYNREVPKARGDAKKLVEEAHGYFTERVNLAQGEASRFLPLLEEHQRSSDVTRRRLYLETMQKVLPQVKEVVVIDQDQKSLLPLLDLTGAGKK